MIVSRAFAGKRFAVLGLARSGMATVEALETADLGVPHSIQDVARDTIVTYRAGRAISSTYL